MTVKELIQRLQQEPPDALVLIYCGVYLEPTVYSITDIGEAPDGELYDYDPDPQLCMKPLGPAVYLG